MCLGGGGRGDRLKCFSLFSSYNFDLHEDDLHRTLMDSAAEINLSDILRSNFHFVSGFRGQRPLNLFSENNNLLIIKRIGNFYIYKSGAG